jgi:hypothetical protein
MYVIHTQRCSESLPFLIEFVLLYYILGYILKTEDYKYLNNSFTLPLNLSAKPCANLRININIESPVAKAFLCVWQCPLRCCSRWLRLSRVFRCSREMRAKVEKRALRPRRIVAHSRGIARKKYNRITAAASDKYPRARVTRRQKRKWTNSLWLRSGAGDDGLVIIKSSND